MKVQYLILFVLLSGVIFSCQKTVDSTVAVDNGSTTVVTGTTSSYGDTTTVSLGDVVIKYSRTSPCYPSNEIFSFSVTSVTGIPSDAVYTWTFGDSNTGTGTSVRNIYSVMGNYTVILTITSSDGKTTYGKNSFSVAARGQEVTPYASFYAQIYNVNDLTDLYFTSQSSVKSPASLTNYLWKWGDGDSSSVATAYTTHSFPQVGTDVTYPVRLIAVANSGCRDTATVPVTISATYSITGSFNTASYNVCTNESIVFTPNVTGAPAGVTYQWDFADASGIATGNPITHSYTYQNDYAVIMYVYLNGRLIYQTGKTVHANGQNIKPVALFVKNMTDSTSTTVSYQFYSSSIIYHGSITGYLWEFYNGTTDNNFDLKVNYTYNRLSTSVTYPQTLIVTGNTGCTDTAVGYVTIPAL